MSREVVERAELWRRVRVEPIPGAVVMKVGFDATHIVEVDGVEATRGPMRRGDAEYFADGVRYAMGRGLSLAPGSQRPVEVKTDEDGAGAWRFAEQQTANVESGPRQSWAAAAGISGTNRLTRLELEIDALRRWRTEGEKLGGFAKVTPTRQMFDALEEAIDRRVAEVERKCADLGTSLTFFTPAPVTASEGD